jgi:hypothetical protein
MNLSKMFHAVKSAGPKEKLAFWKACKASAVAYGAQENVGLTKIALDIWADAYQSGWQPQASRDLREAFSSSFGSAAAVDRELYKLAENGAISEDELAKLSTWVAESAVQDLQEMTKSANAGLLHPQILGALTGAAVGAGLGAWRDKENRTRGAIAGVIPGAVIGATLTAQTSPTPSASTKVKTKTPSAKLADIMQGLDAGGEPPMNADASPVAGEQISAPNQESAENMEYVDQGHQVVDNMIFLANQVQMPQLAQDLDQQRELLANHFADGNVYLPPELQHHFAQSEHAEAFMKKYKQRFGAPSLNSRKKSAKMATAHAASKQEDWLSWRTHR